MVHVQVVALITQSGDKVAIRATPLENTSIQSGGPRREGSLGKMVRQRSKPKSHRSNGKSDAKKRMSLFRRISSKWAEQHLGSPSVLIKPFSWVGRSFSFSDPQASSPKSPVSRNWSFGGDAKNGSPGAESQNICASNNVSTGSNSPPVSGSRPSSFQGIRHKPKVPVQPSKSAGHSTMSHLHKSMHTIQPSPLARTPSPSPLILSPTRSPSPMTSAVASSLPPGISNLPQMYSPARPVQVLARRSLDQPLSYCPSESRLSAQVERASSPDHLHPSAAERHPPRKNSMPEKFERNSDK